MLRLILSPRWIVWHVLTIGAMVTCAYLSAWQWGRAGSASGSALNIGYALQWPAFAIFFGFMWFRMLRMELRQLRGEATGDTAAPDRSDRADRSDRSDRSDRMIAASGRPADLADGVVTSQGPGRLRGDEQLCEVDGAADPGPSPFGPRPGAAAEPPITDETDPELAAYNRMLAALAEHDRAS